MLEAFEAAERDQNVEARRRHLTFVVVGGGPTGVELAGAIGEMSRYTLARDFRSIDPRQTRVILVEAGPRILPSFDDEARGTRDARSRIARRAGVDGLARHRTSLDDGVSVGNEQVAASTVLWAAGVRAADVGRTLGAPVDQVGRVNVGPDLTIPGHPEVFVLGDLARFEESEGKPLPGVALVAMQEGIYAADIIRKEVQRGAVAERAPFRYHDLGQMATIGRSRAIAEFGRLRLGGYFAWWFWLIVHIYRLSGFRNRLSVLIQWAWSYLTFGRGARLIVGKEWQAYPGQSSG